MQNNMYRDNAAAYVTQTENVEKDNDSQWFYKKWDIAAKGQDLQREQRLEQTMEEERERYRLRHEQMGEPFPPAEPFYKMKQVISESRTYQNIFRKMPKGGLLHVHSTAALSVERLFALFKEWCKLIQQGTNLPPIYVVVKENAVQNRFAAGTLLYDYQCQQAGIDVQYIEELSEFLKNPYDENWLKELLTFGSDRILQYPYKWNEFNTIFSRTSRLFKNEEFYYRYHVAFFEECLADKIYYVELRCGFEEFDGADSLFEGEAWEQTESVPYQYYAYAKDMKISTEPWNPDNQFLLTIYRAMGAVNAKQTVGQEIDVKIILCARRALNPVKERDVILKKIDTAIVLKTIWENAGAPFIVGFDFVSEEDRGYPTESYAKDIIYADFCEGYTDEFMRLHVNELLALKEKFKTGSRISKIDFYLHDGESNWNSNTNVIDVAVISKYRIGHGFNMNKHPGCIRGITMIGQSPNSEVCQPVLEICPISNQLLGYYADLRNHSAYQLMKQGVACCLCSDDPQLFGNEGLSYDFWEAYMGMGLSLETVKGLVFTAYYYAQSTGRQIQDGAVITASFNDLWRAFLTEACAAMGIV